MFGRGSDDGLAEQDAVEPKVSKGRCCGEQAQPVDPQHTSCRPDKCNSHKFKEIFRRRNKTNL